MILAFVLLLQQLPEGGSVPPAFLGRYRIGVDCTDSATANLIIEPGAIAMLGKRNDIIMVEPISDNVVHLFVADPEEKGGIAEYHFTRYPEHDGGVVVSSDRGAAEGLLIGRERKVRVYDMGNLGTFYRCPE